MIKFKLSLLLLTLTAITILPGCRDCKDENCPGVGFVRVAGECQCPNDKVTFSDENTVRNPENPYAIQFCQEIGDNDYYGVLPDTMDERFWRDTFMVSFRGDYMPSGAVVKGLINSDETSVRLDSTVYGYYRPTLMLFTQKNSKSVPDKQQIRYDLTYENVRLYPNDSMVGTLRFKSHFTWEIYKVHNFVMRGKNYRQ
jgi:hypothetical protein